MKKSAIVTDFKANRYLYLMLLPVVLFYLVFCYGPMYGMVIAFKSFSPGRGILGSPWVGLKHFRDFFSGVYFGRVLRNTVSISLLSLFFGFPVPIMFALLLNEIRSKPFTRAVQTISYLPHFVSTMVICGIIVQFTGSRGLINDIVEWFGGDRSSLLSRPGLFQPIYVLSGIWQDFGWGSIIYIAALTQIDPELYAAAQIDGANRWKQALHVTIPGIMPTIVILLILRMGEIMGVGFEKIILLYSPVTYETADVISSYIYRRGLQQFDFSYSAAVGFFNTVLNFTFLLCANYLSRKTNDTSLW